MDFNGAVEKMRDRVTASKFDRSVKFDLGDEFVLVKDQAVTTEDGQADCTIALTKENFVAMAAGELNPTSAYMTGKLKVTGDMGVAMQLNRIL